MIRKTHKGIDWLEFEQLQEFPNVKHALFLRHGGVSQGPFDSLNGGGSHDDPLAIQENQRRMMEMFPGAELIRARQVHEAHIEKVEGPWIYPGSCDGLITKEKNRALMINHADCQSALFYDPIENILAHIHCGWRGNVQNIYGRTVEAFKALGSNPANIRVCISPSLGPNQSEFIHFKTEFPEHFQAFQWKNFYFNLWEISRYQLKESGILSAHMELAEICTYEQKKDYFSHRRDKLTGRHAALAMLC